MENELLEALANLVRECEDDGWDDEGPSDPLVKAREVLVKYNAAPCYKLSTKEKL